jgi:hypothetical protein
MFHRPGATATAVPFGLPPGTPPSPDVSFAHFRRTLKWIALSTVYSSSWRAGRAENNFVDSHGGQREQEQREEQVFTMAHIL